VAADAATIGPKDMTANGGGTYACIGGACTMANVFLPTGVGKVWAPFRGKIKKWRVSIPPAHDTWTNDGPLALQVLKRTAENNPGLSDDEYAAVRESKYEDVTPNSVNRFTAKLRVRKGQFIGLAHIDNHTEVMGGGLPGFGLWFEPALVPGQPGAAGFTQVDNDYFVFNANLIRD